MTSLPWAPIMLPWKRWEICPPNGDTCTSGSRPLIFPDRVESMKMTKPPGGRFKVKGIPEGGTQEESRMHRSNAAEIGT